MLHPRVYEPLSPTPVAFWRQLRSHLILAFVSLAIILAAGIETVTITQMDAQAKQQVFRQLESVAQLKQHQIDRWLEDSAAALKVLLVGPTGRQLTSFATDPIAQAHEQAAVNQILKDTLSINSMPTDHQSFRQIFLYTIDGRIVASSDEVAIGRVVTRQPYFVPSLSQAYIQSPYYTVRDGTLTMFMTWPLIDRTGRTVGVLAGELDLTVLGDIMLERSGLGETGETYLVSAESHYLLTPSRFPGYPLTRAYYSLGIDRALGGESGAGIYSDYRSPPTTVLGVYRWIPGLQTALLAEIDLSEALAPATQARNTSVILATIVTLVAALLGLYHAARVSRPIMRLTQVAAQIGRGQLNQRATVDEHNEIGILATVFNQMASQLQEMQAGLEQRITERTAALEQALVELRELTNKQEQNNHELQVSLAQRKQAEAALRESEDSFRLLFANNPLPMWVYDRHTLAFLEVNQAAIAHYGYTRSEFLQMHITDIRPLQEVPELLKQIAQERPTLDASGPWEHQLKDGRVIVVTIHSHTLAFAGHEAALVVVEDITERKRIEVALVEERALLARRVEERTADLSAANAELARAARLKDEFLASMSHELRTPLNAILGLSEALQEEVYGPIKQQQRTSLHNIEKSGRHLLELINDILDLAKVEAGQAHLAFDVVGAADVCQSSLQFITQLAHDKRITVSSLIDPAITTLQADGRRLKQILINLLSNAVKFTPAGGRVGLEVVGDRLNHVVRMTVWDTGIGIATADLPRLFKPFVQLDSRLARQYEGTGLGLALVARMVELHGGSIAVDSTLGQGSRFTITLPWQEPMPPHEGEVPPSTPTAGERLAVIHQVLIIDDSPSTTNQLARYLHELGLVAHPHRTGRDALAQAIALRPDVIILDILLPDHSGWDVLADLKADPRTCAIPVLLISVEDDQLRGMALGAGAYLVKPITRLQLHAALCTLVPLGYTSIVQAVPEGTSLEQSNKPLVLLAEDNEANIATLTDYLWVKGYQVVVARTGYEALTRAQEITPDLILMDIQMPEMDGLEAIRQIRAVPALAAVPIIALTALTMPGDQERCLSVGANAYLSKPVSLKVLATILATQVAAADPKIDPTKADT
jgi:PAS domain S-box-containing protein